MGNLDAKSYKRLDEKYGMKGTSLVWSVRENMLEATRELLELGCRYEYALYECAEHGNLEMCKLILSFDKKEQLSTECALMRAAKNGHLEVCKLILDAFPDVDPEGALMNAAKNGHLEVCKLILDAFPDVDPQSAMALAFESGNQLLVKELTSRGAELQFYESDFVRHAEEGDAEECKRYLKAGVDLHYNNDEAMNLAMKNGRLGVVKVLLSYWLREMRNQKLYTTALVVSNSMPLLAEVQES